MHRRSFLASLGLAPLVARSYFDMGAAWQKHACGLWVVPDDWPLFATVSHWADDKVVETFRAPMRECHNGSYQIDLTGMTTKVERVSFDYY